eukprot:3344768-Pleurochrysis_carterae.AAC.1
MRTAAASGEVTTTQALVRPSAAGSADADGSTSQAMHGNSKHGTSRACGANKYRYRAVDVIRQTHTFKFFSARIYQGQSTLCANVVRTSPIALAALDREASGYRSGEHVHVCA